MRKLIFSSILILSIHWANAQYYSKDANRSSSNGSDFWEKVYYGGNAGASLGRYTFIEISPLAGYKLTDRLSLGLMASYVYLNYKIPLSSGSYNYNTNIVGLSPFARYFLFNWLFLHTELGAFYGKALLIKKVTSTNYAITGENTNIYFYPLVGGGVNIPLGERSAFTVMALVNLGYREDILFYRNQPLVIRIGLVF